jgi:hypothetical protein
MSDLAQLCFVLLRLLAKLLLRSREQQRPWRPLIKRTGKYY